MRSVHWSLKALTARNTVKFAHFLRDIWLSSVLAATHSHRAVGQLCRFLLLPAMCFNPPMSLGVGLASLAFAGWLYKRGKPFRCYQMLLYFAFMEFLQLAQYTVADQCDNPINQALTMAAFVHVAFQPLILNYYMLADQAKPHPQVASFVLKLCMGFAVLTIMRTPLLPIAKLGDLVHEWIPDLPPSSTYGKACHYQEAFCGERLCSITGKAWNHISWSVPLLPTTYFIPGSWAHFFLFFVPTMILGDGIRRLLIGITVLIGPIYSMAMASRAMETYAFEWATIYCFFAATLTVQAILYELWFPASFAPATKQQLQEAAEGAQVQPGRPRSWWRRIAKKQA